jgi:hypothetical protein
MEPIRVRLYGLFPTTRKRYLVVQAFVFGFLAVLLVVAWRYPAPRFGVDERRLPVEIIWFLDHLAWLVLTMIILEALESFVTLRQFARREAAQRQQSAPAVADR